MRIGSGIKFVLGDESVLQAMEKLPPMSIFSEEACGFLQVVSERLMKSKEAKVYPDVVTFAFWCRKASLRQMAEPYAKEQFRIGRGTAFHVAPSNVAVNFAYSMAAALLAGNASIVRVPSKDFPQVEMIVSAMALALQEMPEMKPFFCLVRYGHEKELNDVFSEMSDVRVVWGGDRTIREIRSSPLKPRAMEITFADRYSIAVMDAEAYLRAEDKKRVAREFYNDTYLTDQNACTSPQLIVWLGDRVREAQNVFWEELHDVIEQEGYILQPIQAVDKLMNLCLLGAAKGSCWHRGKDNLMIRAEVDELDDRIMTYRGNSGFFLEYAARDLMELIPICGERCQTISCFGVSCEMLKNLIMKHRLRGGDRIVPFGRTMDFSLIWDGHDLIREMSRRVDS